MDDHARRVSRPFVEAWHEFEQGRATLLDLSRLAEHTASGLDNASAPLPRLLAAAGSDREYAYHANEQEDHELVGRRIIALLMAALAEG